VPDLSFWNTHSIESRQPWGHHHRRRPGFAAPTTSMARRHAHFAAEAPSRACVLPAAPHEAARARSTDGRGGARSRHGWTYRRRSSRRRGSYPMKQPGAPWLDELRRAHSRRPSRDATRATRVRGADGRGNAGVRGERGRVDRTPSNRGAAEGARRAVVRPPPRRVDRVDGRRIHAYTGTHPSRTGRPSATAMAFERGRAGSRQGWTRCRWSSPTNAVRLDHTPSSTDGRGSRARPRPFASRQSAGRRACARWCRFRW
jgi:hypothetical protein